MDEVLLRKALVKSGFSDQEIVQLVRTGELQRLRRGAYAKSADPEPSLEDQHRRLVAATLPPLPQG